MKKSKNIIGIIFILLSFVLGVISETKSNTEINFYVGFSFLSFLFGIWILIKNKKQL